MHAKEGYVPFCLGSCDIRLPSRDAATAAAAAAAGGGATSVAVVAAAAEASAPRHAFMHGAAYTAAVYGGRHRQHSHSVRARVRPRPQRTTTHETVLEPAEPEAFDARLSPLGAKRGVVPTINIVKRKGNTQQEVHQMMTFEERSAGSTAVRRLEKDREGDAQEQGCSTSTHQHRHQQQQQPHFSSKNRAAHRRTARGAVPPCASTPEGLDKNDSARPVGAEHPQKRSGRTPDDDDEVYNDNEGNGDDESYGDGVDLTVVARQKAFVKRVASLGRTKQAREVLDLMGDVEETGSIPFNLYMYNACITALGRCGSWRQALAILDRMRLNAAAADAKFSATEVGRGGGGRGGDSVAIPPIRPDVYSFSAAITACSNAGKRRRALALLSDMRAEGIPPTVVSYNAAASAYICDSPAGSRGRTGSGKEDWQAVLALMGEMRADGVPPDAITFCIAITACGRAGQWERALSLLDEMDAQEEPPLEPDVTAINAAISACCSAGKSDKALELLYRMRTREGALIGSIATSHNDKPASPASISSHHRGVSSVEAHGGDPQPRPTSPRESEAASWPAADTVSFNAAMDGCAKAGRWREGLALLERMRAAGVRPDVCSYAACFACLRVGGKWERALELLDEMEADADSRLSPDLGCYGVVISTLGEARMWQRALDLLRLLQRRGSAGAASWAVTQAAEAGWGAERLAAEATGYAEKSSLAMAGPNLVCYNAAMAACAKAGEWDPALDLLKEMEERGIFDTTSFNCAMHACRGQGQWQRATGLLDRMIRGDAVRGPGGTERTVPRPDAYSFASAITACGAVGQADRAVELLREMRAAGVAPTVVVFNAVIGAVARGVNRPARAERKGGTARDGDGDGDFSGGPTAAEAGETDDERDAIAAREARDSWKRAYQLVVEMRENGLAPDLRSYNTVLAVCQRAGAWEGALEVLEEMKRGKTRRHQPVPSPDLISFNTAMGACGRARKWEEALRLLEEVCSRGYSADVVTYNTAAAACAREKKWNLALEVIKRGRRAGVIAASVYPGEEGKYLDEGGVGAKASTGAEEVDGHEGLAASSGGRVVDSGGFYAVIEEMVRRGGNRSCRPDEEGGGVADGGGS